MKELWWKLEGAQDQDWQHTAAMMAMMHNLQCTKKSQMKPPKYFNPMSRNDEPKERLTKKQTTVALKSFLQAMTKGKFDEHKCKYVLKDGAYVLEDTKVVKKVE